MQYDTKHLYYLDCFFLDWKTFGEVKTTCPSQIFNDEAKKFKLVAKLGNHKYLPKFPALFAGTKMFDYKFIFGAKSDNINDESNNCVTFESKITL